MIDRELMQQALEALNRSDYLGWQLNIPIIKALRERLAQPEFDSALQSAAMTQTAAKLAQPEQEPVAWMYKDSWGTMKLSQIMPPPAGAFPVYTTPPRREWVGLTEEEVDECYYWKGRQWTTDELVRHVEAKLKEKNA